MTNQLARSDGSLLVENGHHVRIIKVNATCRRVVEGDAIIRLSISADQVAEVIRREIRLAALTDDHSLAHRERKVFGPELLGPNLVQQAPEHRAPVQGI